jgi:hypothetical protein
MQAYSRVRDLLFAAEKELFQSAFAVDGEVSGVSLRAFSHCVLVNVSFNFLDQLDLFSTRVKCHSKRVVRAEESLENFIWISVELVALNTIKCLVAVLQSRFAEPVVDFSETAYNTS